MTARLRVGYDADFAPLTFAEDSSVAGLVIDILNLSFGRIGCVAEYVAVALPEQENAVTAGEIDAIAFKAVVPERAAAYDFSAPLTTSGAAWFNRTGMPCGERPSAGSRIATPGAGPLLAQLQRDYPGLVYLDVDTYAESLDAVIGGTADCAALNFHVGCYLANRDHPGGFNLPDAPFQKLPLALAVAKGANASLLRDFDTALAALREDGSLDEIEARWVRLEEPG